MYDITHKLHLLVQYIIVFDTCILVTKLPCTPKLALPVFLIYLSRPSRNIHYDARVTFLRFASVSVSILTLLTANAAFTLITIRPRLVSWCSSWTNRDYRIQSYQIVSHLDVNRDNRANRGKFFGCQKFCHDYHDWRDHRGDRIRSYDIVTNRNESYLILFLNRGYRDQPKYYDLLR